MPIAMYLVGVCYNKGDGVDKALEWLTKASELGNEQASALLKKIKK